MSTNKIPVALDDSKDDRTFERLVVWVSALSIAAMAGFLASLKQVNPVIEVRFSAATVIAFVAAGVLTTLFLRMVLHTEKRWRTPLVVTAVILSVLGYFLIGIKDTAKQNRSDVMIGTALAVAVLSCVALVLWRLGHFLESDELENQDKRRDEFK
jgi:peptidoglycan/LPS O-acetylase OafA/YrhL